MRPPPKDKDARVAAGIEKHNGISTTTAEIIPLPLTRRNCAACHIQLRPRASHHQLCPTCFSGALAYHHITQARRLLGGR